MTHNGYGISYYNNLIGMPLFVGEFKDGCFHGKGQMYFINGELEYEGEFKNGYFHGIGKLYHPNNKLKYKGIFVNNLFYNGFQYNENNKLIAKYVDGKIKSNWKTKYNSYSWF